MLNVPEHDVQSAMDRARQLDSLCKEEAIRGYLREIMEAESMLDEADFGNRPLDVAFSPSWQKATEE